MGVRCAADGERIFGANRERWTLRPSTLRILLNPFTPCGECTNDDKCPFFFRQHPMLGAREQVQGLAALSDRVVHPVIVRDRGFGWWCERCLATRVGVRRARYVAANPAVRILEAAKVAKVRRAAVAIGVSVARMRDRRSVRDIFGCRSDYLNPDCIPVRLALSNRRSRGYQQSGDEKGWFEHGRSRV